MNTHTESDAVTCRIVAPSSRQALRLLRERLGPDAIVLSNKVIAEGVEIVATLDEAVADAPDLSVHADVAAAMPAPSGQALPEAAHPVASAPEPQAALTPQAAVDSGSVLHEIHSMRGMIEEQLAGIRWNEAQRRDPLRGQLLRTLLGAGFSARLAKDLLANLPTGQNYADGMRYLKAAMAQQMPMLEDEDALMNEGGIYALMGPTGVGKTTTTAKLAARCVMRFGPEKLALVTTDSYRIGAYEQLRIYGQILGVSVHAVKDAVDLELVLSDLKDKHMVLIDTVGMSQRDRAVSDQIAMLCGASRPVKRLLLLNAASHGDTLNEVVQAYRNGVSGAGGTALSGCIFTKVDEATHPGALIDTVIRHQLPVHYISSGQKVPEHLMLGDRNVLIDSVFQAKSKSSLFVPGEADLAEETAVSKKGAELAAAEAVSERLRSQCQQLIRTLAHNAQELTSNAAALAGGQIGFDDTRLLWRTLADERVGKDAIEQMLASQVSADIKTHCSDHLLVAAGEVRPTLDAGADSAMTVGVLLSDRTGQPFAAVPQHEMGGSLIPGMPMPGWLRPASCADRSPVHLLAHLPAYGVIQALHATGVHWAASAAAALRVLVPGDEAPKTLLKLAAGLSFSGVEPVLYKKKTALLSVAEMTVALCFDSKFSGAGGGLVSSPLRCVVTRLVDIDTGKVLRLGYLLASPEVKATALQMAQWPAWRATADAYFKLLGQNLQQLGDVSAFGELAPSKRLLVAGQASTTIFRLQQAKGTWPETARKVLAQLAGRSVRADRAIPGTALFEGLGKLFVLLDAMDTGDAAVPVSSGAASVQG